MDIERDREREKRKHKYLFHASVLSLEENEKARAGRAFDSSFFYY